MYVNRKPTKKDLEQIDAIKEEDIDYSDIPDLSNNHEFWSQAILIMPKTKKQLTVRLDPDILDWLRSQGKGYQTKINAILRSYMRAHQNL